MASIVGMWLKITSTVGMWHQLVGMATENASTIGMCINCWNVASTFVRCIKCLNGGLKLHQQLELASTCWNVASTCWNLHQLVAISINVLELRLTFFFLKWRLMLLLGWRLTSAGSNMDF